MILLTMKNGIDLTKGGFCGITPYEIINGLIGGRKCVRNDLWRLWGYWRWQ